MQQTEAFLQYMNSTGNSPDETKEHVLPASHDTTVTQICKVNERQVVLRAETQGNKHAVDIVARVGQSYVTVLGQQGSV